MPAETLRRWADSLAVRTRLHIAPVHVQSVGARFAFTCLVLLKLLLTHRLATIVIAHNLIILDESLDMLCSIIVQDQSFRHFPNYPVDLFKSQ